MRAAEFHVRYTQGFDDIDVAAVNRSIQADWQKKTVVPWPNKGARFSADYALKGFSIVEPSLGFTAFELRAALVGSMMRHVIAAYRSTFSNRKPFGRFLLR